MKELQTFRNRHDCESIRERHSRRINFYRRSFRRAELIKPSVRSFVRSASQWPSNGWKAASEGMEDSQSVPNPLFQCNYFYASRELLPMTATTAGGGGGGDETRRDETRRGAMRRRHRVCPLGGEPTLVSPRRDARRGRWNLGWSGSPLHTRSHELQLSRWRTEAENAMVGKRWASWRVTGGGGTKIGVIGSISASWKPTGGN